MKHKIAETTEESLKKLLADKREVLRSFKFGATGTKVKNVKTGKNTKKEIARILTKLTELKKKGA